MHLPDALRLALRLACSSVKLQSSLGKESTAAGSSNSSTGLAAPPRLLDKATRARISAQVGASRLPCALPVC
jgi:hypothetical protein